VVKTCGATNRTRPASRIARPIDASVAPRE
jgi:hypothetical protein